MCCRPSRHIRKTCAPLTVPASPPNSTTCDCWPPPCAAPSPTKETPDEPARDRRPPTCLLLDADGRPDHLRTDRQLTHGQRKRPMNLPEIAVRRPVFSWMLMAGLIIFGLIGSSRMGISQLPDVDFPVVSI